MVRQVTGLAITDLEAIFSPAGSSAADRKEVDAIARIPAETRHCRRENLLDIQTLLLNNPRSPEAITDIRAREDKVQELVKWKDRIDEVASPTQIKELKEEVEDLKLFKTKAVTIFAVIQFAMAAVVFAQRFI